MRPNTIESGILSTKRKSPVSPSMLRRMWVPKPKNAFQSPGVHKAGRYVVVCMDPLPPIASCVSQPRDRRRQCGEHRTRRRNPAENPALRRDHAQRDLVKLRKIGGAAVGQND